MAEPIAYSALDAGFILLPSTKEMVSLTMPIEPGIFFYKPSGTRFELTRGFHHEFLLNTPFLRVPYRLLHSLGIPTHDILVEGKGEGFNQLIYSEESGRGPVSLQFKEDLAAHILRANCVRLESIGFTRTV